MTGKSILYTTIFMKYSIKVIPWAKKLEISELEDIFWNKILKVKLTAKPTDWEANAQLIQVLSDYFDVSKSKISIVSWQTSRNKIVEIKD